MTASGTTALQVARRLPARPRSRAAAPRARPGPTRPSTAIAAEPPVASMGSSRNTTALAEVLAAPSRSSGAPPPSPRCARGRSSRPAACGTSSRNASSMPEAGAQHGHRHHPRGDAARRPPSPAGVSTVRLGEGEVAGGLRGQQQAHAAGQAAELVARRGAVAQPGQRVLDERDGARRAAAWAAEDSTAGAAAILAVIHAPDADEIEFIARKIVKTLVARGQARGRLRAPRGRGARHRSSPRSSRSRTGSTRRSARSCCSTPREMERSNITYTEMFKMVKKKMAKEKGIIL